MLLEHTMSVMSIPAAGAGVKSHPAFGTGVNAFDKYNIAQTLLIYQYFDC